LEPQIENERRDRENRIHPGSGESAGSLGITATMTNLPMKGKRGFSHATRVANGTTGRYLSRIGYFSVLTERQGTISQKRSRSWAKTENSALKFRYNFELR
jgi:hypothetical protein